MAATYVVSSFPAPVVVVDNNEAATYVVATTVVIASVAAAPAPSPTFMQVVFMYPSILLLCLLPLVS